MSMNGEQKNQLPDRELVLTLRKLHRSEQAVEYIKSCQINRVTPLFAQMAKNTRETLHKCQLSSAKIASLEKKRLIGELKVQAENIDFFKCKISALFENLKHKFSNLGHFEHKKLLIETKVAKLEKIGTLIEL